MHMRLRESYDQDLFDFRRDLDHFFNRLSNWGLSREPNQLLSGGFSPEVESCIDQDGKRFHCEVMLPGVDPKNVKIQVVGDALSISGERSCTRETRGADYLQREVVYGSFQRTIPLAPGVDKDRINADLHNGVLEINAPIAAAALPRKIEVKSTSAAKQVSA